MSGMKMTHRIWTPPRLARGGRLETVCGISVVNDDAVQIRGDECEFMSQITRPHSGGRCCDCFGPINDVMPSEFWRPE